MVNISEIGKETLKIKFNDEIYARNFLGCEGELNSRQIEVDILDNENKKINDSFTFCLYAETEDRKVFKATGSKKNDKYVVTVPNAVFYKDGIVKLQFEISDGSTKLRTPVLEKFVYKSVLGDYKGGMEALVVDFAEVERVTKSAKELNFEKVNQLVKDVDSIKEDSVRAIENAQADLEKIRKENISEMTNVKNEYERNIESKKNSVITALENTATSEIDKINNIKDTAERNINSVKTSATTEVISEKNKAVVKLEETRTAEEQKAKDYIDAYVKANKDKLKGEKGDPGKIENLSEQIKAQMVNYASKDELSNIANDCVSKNEFAEFKEKLGDLDKIQMDTFNNLKSVTD